VVGIVTIYNDAPELYIISATPVAYTLTVPAGIVTLYLDVDLALPENTILKAFRAGVIQPEEDNMSIYAIGSTIPANTPVILMGNQTETYTLTVTSGADPITATNYLRGSLVDITVDAAKEAAEAEGITSPEIFTLGYSSGGKKALGFYVYTGTTLAGTKAYLPYAVETESSVNGFTLTIKDENEETTGVVKLTDNSIEYTGDVYDLAGRKVSKPGKGIYIINGEKVIK